MIDRYILHTVNQLGGLSLNDLSQPAVSFLFCFVFIAAVITRLDQYPVAYCDPCMGCDPMRKPC